MRTGSRRRLWLTIAAATVTAAMASAPSALAGTAGTSAWRVQNATDNGAYTASRMSVTLALAERNAGALNALLAQPHAALTPAQFAAQFAPATATVDAIRTWAAANHLSVVSVSSNRLLVTLAGSSTQISQALQTGLRRFHTAANGNFFAASKPAQLPTAFAANVSAVLGLSSLAKVAVPQPSSRSAAALAIGRAAFPAAGLPTSLNYPAIYTPQDFWSMYDAPSGADGRRAAVVDHHRGRRQPAEGRPGHVREDLRPAHGDVESDQRRHRRRTDTSGDDEWDLDSQYSTAFAPGVTTLNVYVGPSLSDADILTTVNKWVTDDLSRQGSFSAGECDLLADASGFTSGLDAVLKQAAAQGQTMFFSSGDTGSQCPAIAGVNGVPAGIPDTNYPASSPYGIGVGGTSVLSNNPLTEIAWYAGGGGLSPVEPAASFQANAKVLGVAAPPTRGVPDVSLDADPESGYDVVVGGTVEGIGGTSASAPSWQGIWARAEGAHGGSLGFAGPILYSTVPSSAFHDITAGANGAYSAGPGYDLVTGLGTPDIAKLVSGT